MSERKDEKWLDNQLQRAINGVTPAFDAQAWKQKHREEYQTLVARGEQTAGTGLPGSAKVRSAGGIGKLRRLRLPLPPRRWLWWGKLAVAATIVLSVGLLALRNDKLASEEPTPSVADSSPAKMMSMMSLRMAYQRGGFDAVDRQLQDTLDEFGPRSSSVPIRELF